MAQLQPILAQYGDPSSVDNMAAMLGAFFAVLVVPLTILVLIYVLPYWILFSRAGQPGFAAIIPIYNIWVYCKVAGRNPLTYLLVTILGIFAAIIVPALVELVTLFLSFGILGSLVYWVITVGLCVLWMIVSWDFATVFNAKPVVAMLYVLMPWLGVFFLLFGDHHYCGPFHKADERIMMGPAWALSASAAGAYGQPGAYPSAEPGYGTPAGQPGYSSAGYVPSPAPSPQGQYDPSWSSPTNRQSLVSDWTIGQTPDDGPIDPGQPASPLAQPPLGNIGAQPVGQTPSPFALPAGGQPPAPTPPQGGTNQGDFPSLAPDPPGHSPSNQDIGLPPFDPSA